MAALRGFSQVRVVVSPLAEWQGFSLKASDCALPGKPLAWCSKHRLQSNITDSAVGTGTEGFDGSLSNIRGHDKLSARLISNAV